jgi:hypothetical protein
MRVNLRASDIVVNNYFLGYFPKSRKRFLSASGRTVWAGRIRDQLKAETLLAPYTLARNVALRLFGAGYEVKVFRYGVGPRTVNGVFGEGYRAV